MKRQRWWAIPVLGLGLLIVAAWIYLRRPAVLALDASEVSEVQVQLEPWGDAAVPPGVNTADPKIIAALVTVLRSGVETSDHKCGSRGIITLRRGLNRPVQFRFLPGHHEQWYEFRYAGHVYRVPRAEFVAAMRGVGIEVPLECH